MLGHLRGADWVMALKCERGMEGGELRRGGRPKNVPLLENNYLRYLGQHRKPTCNLHRKKCGVETQPTSKAVQFQSRKRILRISLGGEWARAQGGKT